MNSDMSTAPEIARLAVSVPVQGRVAGGRTPTIGEMARELCDLAGRPELIRRLTALAQAPAAGRFEVPAGPGVVAWASVLAPGTAGLYCECDLMTVLSGDLAEEVVADGGLTRVEPRPGGVRVHGRGQVRQIMAAGRGPALTLHVRSASSENTNDLPPTG